MLGMATSSGLSHGMHSFTEELRRKDGVRILLSKLGILIEVRDP